MKLVLGIFRKIRRKAWLIKSKFVCWKWMKIYGHDIGKDVIISPNARLDKDVRGIHIGEGTHVLSDALLLNHDHCRKISEYVYIGYPKTEKR